MGRRRWPHIQWLSRLGQQSRRRWQHLRARNFGWPTVLLHGSSSLAAAFMAFRSFLPLPTTTVPASTSTLSDRFLLLFRGVFRGLLAH